ncbi:FxLD family lantipeptide [Actinokineospora sp. HBU206404]|uniref:FxLD family lantipeptide n=1 Tax=Actinokineospora xionganensis TaxID=2684470 RepID=A0ABR7LEI6_9PSEU|nr:FxLD family lantipeptide [Actinokineospora xionganensis]
MCAPRAGWKRSTRTDERTIVINTLDDFDLDVAISTDLGTGDQAAAAAACRTDDGCAATCASSCVSNV